MNARIIDPDDTDGPIHALPLTWDDEKPHNLASDWSERPCWCEPRIEGKYVHHRSVFDAIDQTAEEAEALTSERRIITPDLREAANNG